MTARKANKKAILGIALLLVVTTLACRVGAAEPLTAPSEGEQVATPEAVLATPEAPAASSPPSSTTITEIFGEDQVLVDLYDRTNPAVVNITVYATQGGSVVALGEGSGFVYDNQGHIITNAHVVAGSDTIEVTFWDGLINEASLVGQDQHSDLAVVKVSSLPEGITPLALGSMDELHVGQSVVAIGNPFGNAGTLTRGIISALGRNLPAETGFTIPQAIQTDAAINPGNSGGPLLNLNGEVIGVTSQIETGGTGRANTGIGFAVPVSIISRVVPSLVQSGHYDWPWLGIAGGDVSPVLVQAMQLTVERGAYIAEVVDGGPAAQAGLQGASQVVSVGGRQVGIGGDIITAVDGQIVNTFDDVLIYLATQSSPGEDVVLTILRDGQTQDVTVTLGERPASTP